MNADGQLPDEIARKFLAGAIVRSYVAGQELFDARSRPTAMYGVLEGQMRVSLLGADGRQPVSAVLGPGQWFGETPLLDRQARAFRAEAQEACKIAVVPAAFFHELIRGDNAALLAVTHLVCARYRLVLAWTEEMLLHSFQAQLAGRLLAAPAPVVRLSQQELASQLGTSRATVNRQLRAWEQQGVLRLGYRSIEVLDRAALKAIRPAP